MKLLFVACDVSIVGEYVVFLLILILDVEGDSSMLSHCTILDLPLGNTILYISPNWSSGVILTVFIGLWDPLNAQ